MAKAIGGDLVSIPKALKNSEHNFSDEVIGFVFPCYAGCTPPIVEQFVNQSSFKAEYYFAVMTYGSYDCGGVAHFNKIARNNKIKLSYLNSILMIDNYLNFFDMEREQKLLPQKNTAHNLTRICTEIKERQHFIKNPGMIMRAISAIASRFNPFIPGSKDKNFSIEDHCNGCGLCAKVCPVDNIKINNKPEFMHKCIVCYACTHNCPQNAIRVKGERSKARYRNPGVTLEEIISAND